MCRDSYVPRRVELTITNKYRRTYKIKNCQEEPVGIGGWTQISTSISPPPLGINRIHCIELPHQVRKILLNLALGELLSLVEEFPYLDSRINMDPLLVSSLDLCVHYMISGCLFHAVMIDLCRCHFFCDL
jgi:hypothetical protein